MTKGTDDKDLVERLRRDIARLNEEGCEGAPYSFIVAADRIEQLSSGGIVEALKSADDALRAHACHGGPGVPCLRSHGQCVLECGKSAGDALLKVTAALQSLQVGGGE